MCVCVCVWAFGSSCMSGCSILWQQPVKMFHLSSGDPFVLCVCMCVYMCVCGRLGPRVCQDAPSFGDSLSRCSIFRQVTLLSSVCVCACVCIWAFGSSCRSGFQQQPVKMFHLSSGDPLSSVCVCLGVWVLVYDRMLHPLVTACQDVPSFVR